MSWPGGGPTSSRSPRRSRADASAWDSSGRLARLRIRSNEFVACRLNHHGVAGHGDAEPRFAGARWRAGSAGRRACSGSSPAAGVAQLGPEWRARDSARRPGIRSDPRHSGVASPATSAPTRRCGTPAARAVVRQTGHRSQLRLRSTCCRSGHRRSRPRLWQRVLWRPAPLPRRASRLRAWYQACVRDPASSSSTTRSS